MIKKGDMEIAEIIKLLIAVLVLALLLGLAYFFAKNAPDMLSSIKGAFIRK